MTTNHNTGPPADVQDSPPDRPERTILPNKMIGAARSGPLLLWAMLEHKMLEDTDLGEVDFGELADRLQWHRATVYRWRDALEDRGLLDYDGRPGHRGRHTYCLAYQRGALHTRNGQARTGSLQIDIRLYYEHDLSPDAVMLYSYLERQTLSKFTWKAARKALNLTRRRLGSARDQLQARGLINGHETVNLCQNRTVCSENRDNSEAGKCSNPPERPDNGGEDANLSQNRTDSREDSQPVAEMAEPVADIGQPVAEPYTPSVKHSVKHSVQHPPSNGTGTDGTLSLPDGVSLPDRVGDALKSRKSQRPKLRAAIIEAWETLPSPMPINEALKDLAEALRTDTVKTLGGMFTYKYEDRLDKFRQKMRKRENELDREVKTMSKLFAAPYLTAFREAIQQQGGWDRYRQTLILRSLATETRGGAWGRKAENHFCLAPRHAGQYGADGITPRGLLVEDFNSFIGDAFGVDLLKRMQQTAYVRELMEGLSRLANGITARDGRMIDPAEPEKLIREFFTTALEDYFPQDIQARYKVSNRAREEGHNLDTTGIVGAYRFWLRENHPDRAEERRRQLPPTWPTDPHGTDNRGSATENKEASPTSPPSGTEDASTGDTEPQKSYERERAEELLQQLRDETDEDRVLVAFTLTTSFLDELTDEEAASLREMARENGWDTVLEKLDTAEPQTTGATA